MKTALVLATIVSMAAADCHLSASYKALSASGTIPSVTTISDACCDDVQTHITKYFNNPNSPPQPSQQEQAQLMQDCQSFAMYMQQWRQAHGDEPPPQKMADLPVGFKFKESESGGGATACTLHARFGAASVSCDIPESTTISTECCDAVQGTISQPPWQHPQEPQELQQDLMTKCQSVMMWGQQRMGSVGPPPQDGRPEATLRYMSKALPAGMSCTEKTVSGMSGSMLNAILDVVEISGRSDIKELEAQPASSSLFPTIFVAGTAGALGGLLVLFAVSKLSSNSQRVSLISDDA